MQPEARPRSLQMEKLLSQQHAGGCLQNPHHDGLPAKIKQGIPMAFLRDVHHGKLEVLRGLRPAATLQTPTGGRIKDSHHGPEPRRRGPAVSPSVVGGGSASSFLNILRALKKRANHMH